MDTPRDIPQWILDELRKCYSEIYTTQVYPYETKGKPKGDDILRKYFPEIKDKDGKLP